MKVLHRVVTALTLLPSFSSALMADTPFGDTVPREVVEQLIGNVYGTESALYSDVFADFPPFAVPAGFEVLASTDQGIVQRVLLRTELDAEQASSILAAAFAAEGWRVMPASGGGAQQTGFVSASRPPEPLQLCSDQLGRLAIHTTQTDPRYVTITRADPGRSNGQVLSCEEEEQRLTQGPDFFRSQRGIGPGIQQHLPRLVMPESNVDEVRPPGIFAGGGGGSSNDYETRGMLTIDWSGAQLLEHFAGQVAQQGWQGDAEVAGAQVAYGSWTKTVEDMQLIGMLTLTKTADATWDMKFRIVRQGPAAPQNRVIGR